MAVEEPKFCSRCGEQSLISLQGVVPARAVNKEDKVIGHWRVWAWQCPSCFKIVKEVEILEGPGFPVITPEAGRA